MKLLYLNKRLKILLFVLGCLVHVNGMAQTNITFAEWYVDNDPGYGNARAVALTGLPNLTFTYSRIDTLSVGLHNIGLRAKDANGRWSHDERWMFIKSAVATSSPALSAAEWYLDTDPGYGKASTISLTGLPNLTFSYNRIDTLGTGLHMIGLRAKDANGIWSQDERWLFIKSGVAAAIPAINGAEWYLDSDPGFGKATPVAITGLPNLNIPFNRVDTLGAGLHMIGLRSRDVNGTWSQDERWMFIKSAVAASVPSISGVEWYLDGDPGFGKATPIAITGLPNLNISFNHVDTLGSGLHVIGLRSKDVNGTWSLDERWLFIKSAVATASSNIVYAEYYVDTDTGYGKGSPIPLTPAQNLSNLSFTRNISGLSSSVIHKIGVRSKDANGRWSEDESYLFTTNAVLPVTGLEISAIKNNQTVLVSWSTLAEMNTKDYTVEKSSDGISFGALSTLPARGNSTTKTNYTYTDAHPSTGINYYRIRQADIDNKFIYSAITSVLFEADLNRLVVYPNPARDVVQVKLTSNAATVQVTIYDAQGRSINFNKLTANGLILLNVGGLASGLYHIKISDGKKNEWGRFVKE